jgi:uncharacterized protein YaaW (UPF0174 family)
MALERRHLPLWRILSSNLRRKLTLISNESLQQISINQPLKSSLVDLIQDPSAKLSPSSLTSALLSIMTQQQQQAMARAMAKGRIGVAQEGGVRAQG